MDYLVCILILAWLVYTLYEDWKDAHSTGRQLTMPQFFRNKLINIRKYDSKAGKFVLIWSVATIGP